MLRRALARFLPALLVIVALGGLVVAFQSHNDPVATELPRAMRVVQPDAGEVVLRQDIVFYELEAGWTGGLRIDSREIPPDQLQRIDGINRISFTPGPGKEIEELQEGRHCATAVFWRITESRDDAELYSWCFTAA